MSPNHVNHDLIKPTEDEEKILARLVIVKYRMKSLNLLKKPWALRGLCEVGWSVSENLGDDYDPLTQGGDGAALG